MKEENTKQGGSSTHTESLAHTIERIFLGRCNTGDLCNLDGYEYKSVDHSPLSKYVLKYYWDWVAGQFPYYIAPNTITASGLACILLAFLIMRIFLKDMATPASSCVYLSFSVLVWLYSTLDNADGKHARKTGNSSPLGEIFDHGCDALTVGIIGMLHMGSLGLGECKSGFAIPIILMAGFYLCTWETYHRGYLVFGFVNGPTEGIVLICLTFLLSAVYGPQIWMQQMVDIDILGIRIETASQIILGLYIAFLFFYQIPYSIISVLQEEKSSGKKKQSCSVWELVPIASYLTCCAIWLYASPDDNIFRNNIYLYTVTMSLTFGFIMIRVILAHLVKKTFPMFHLPTVPVAAGAFMACFWSDFKKYETVFLWFCFLFSFFSHFALSVRTSDCFCRYLGICVFTVRPKIVVKGGSKKKDH